MKDIDRERLLKSLPEISGVPNYGQIQLLITGRVKYEVLACIATNFDTVAILKASLVGQAFLPVK